MEIKDIINNENLIEEARLAIEDELVNRRDSRISTLRNNGLCIKEKDGRSSHIIRMSIEDAIIMALKLFESK